MPGERPPCVRTQKIAEQFLLLFEERHSQNVDDSLSEEDLRIIEISRAMRDLLLYDAQDTLDRNKLQQRCLELSKVLQRMLEISLAEGDLSEDLSNDLSRVIARLLADVYSGC